MTPGSAGGARRRLQLHAGVAEKNPRAANIGIGDTELGAEDAFTERCFRIGFKDAQQSLVQGGLRRGAGESGGGPDGDGATVGREKQGLGKTRGIDVVEESV